ncbi:hypothetical protein KAR91_68275 [Candidatus Pacearchaeota archaeon]|nr:hypothetical protein [Candidatus Pacearchaeota archaeon]
MSPYKRMQGDMTPDIARQVIALKARKKIRWADIPKLLGLKQEANTVRAYCNKFIAGKITLDPKNNGPRKKRSDINCDALMRHWICTNIIKTE